MAFFIHKLYTDINLTLLSNFKYNVDMKKSLSPKRKIKTKKANDLQASWGRSYKTKEQKCGIIHIGSSLKEGDKNEEDISRQDCSILG